MRDHQNYLSFHTLTSASLYDALVLSTLQSILYRVAPQWCAELFVVEDEEEMENGLQIEISDPKSLYSILQREARKTDPFRQCAWENTAKMVRAAGKPFPLYDPERLSADFVITDTQQDLMLFLSYDNKPNLVEQNTLGGHCYSNQVDSIRSEVFIQALFLEAVKQLSLDYGHAESTAEWNSKNHDAKGYVVGIDWTQRLPGLYWLNFFGSRYCSFIGKQKLLSAPGKWVRELSTGVLIALGDSPHDWDSREYRDRCAAVEQHLGKEFFFSIDEPARMTRAPDLFLR